jgi:hypothetical protein
MFRFTIRDVLWLTVVVAVFMAWRVDRKAWINEANVRMMEVLRDASVQLAVVHERMREQEGHLLVQRAEVARLKRAAEPNP